ncbi:MAG TPA: SIMPL domain-containing protein [Candidatus Limnocylindrales bacterium]|nr:SIMPL domain-containing protein [Candidatus Limnocylindrales bacterium]
MSAIPPLSPRTVSISLPVPSARSAWLAAGIALGLLTAILAGPLLAARSGLAVDTTGSTTPEHTITVSGTGSVIISPDIADLRLGVVSTASTVKAARQAAATAMTAVIASLKKLGIDDKDIQTSILSLQPSYDYTYQTNPPKVTGYTLSNSIAVTVRNLDNVGDAIDGALAAGATSLDGVDFRVDDQTAADKQARQSAMADAKAKAQALADAAGVSITGVSSISEQVAPVPYPVYYGAAAAGAPDAKSVPTPVQPGTNEIDVTLTVVYLIG